MQVTVVCHRETYQYPQTISEREELKSTQHCFTLTIGAYYQQSKLIPSWGRIEQPGSTYYLQKVSHDVLGIVDHSKDESTVYLFDERIGPKNTNHTVSLLTPGKPSHISTPGSVVSPSFWTMPPAPIRTFFTFLGLWRW